MADSKSVQNLSRIKKTDIFFLRNRYENIWPHNGEWAFLVVKKVHVKFKNYN